MGKASRDKGANFERRLVREANAAGVPADRLAPLQAGRVPGAPDVRLRTWPELHIEAKADERLSVDAMVRQAKRDAAVHPGDARVPVVVYKRNRQPVRAVVPWEWMLDVLAELDGLRDEVELPRQIAAAARGHW